jgi:hypothetical protein
MSDNPLQIRPSTKVADLLDAYPELEEILINMAPPFKKLKNPILRKSVAKVATLQQAAIVGRVDVSSMIDQLRKAVGLAPSETGRNGDNPDHQISQGPGRASGHRADDHVSARPGHRCGESQRHSDMDGAGAR